MDNIQDAWFESVQQVAIRGTPDIIGVIKGRFIALELKATKRSSITAMQKHKLDLIQKSGGYAYVVYPENMEEVLKELESI